MLSAYGLRNGGLAALDAPADCRGLSRAAVVWIDLLDPTPDEERAVEDLLGLAVPTRQEMAEIEESARLYAEAGALVMTAVVIEGVTEGRPKRAQATFVLNADHLVTVRYANPLPFRNFAAKCARQPQQHQTAAAVLVSLLETIVERAADVLEGVAAELNEIASALFLDERERGPAKAEIVLRSIVRRLGRKNITISVLRESLVSLSRLVPFLRQGAGGFLPEQASARLKAIDRDLRSLSAYEDQMSAEIGYLHEATLGLINLDQNRIIKVFSVAAVLFLPPTLVGTVYGMNFEFMPELGWLFGYPMALGLMALSALIPFLWFKRRGWL